MLFTTSEAAEQLRLKPETLETWRCRGGGPVFVKLGRAIRYRQEDIDTFINAAARRNTGDQGGTDQ